MVASVQVGRITPGPATCGCGQTTRVIFHPHGAGAERFDPWRSALGGQGVERRDILRYLGIAAVASTFPGFHRWAFACPGSYPSVPGPSPTSGSYQPLFFSPAQYRLVERLAEMIIPE